MSLIGIVSEQEIYCLTATVIAKVICLSHDQSDEQISLK